LADQFKWIDNKRGVEKKFLKVFGIKAVANFCASLNIDLICRAHQCVIDGYEFFADRKCLTIFSAPCYCGELDNQAGVLIVNSRLECRVLTFKRGVKPVTKTKGASTEEAAPGSMRTQEDVKKTQGTPTVTPQRSAETCKSSSNEQAVVAKKESTNENAKKSGQVSAGTSNAESNSNDAKMESKQSK
ncbi:unnamed protein product, partial [Strongylus vulgaris]